jgi:outer membrane protein assembly factor BamB
MPPLNPDGPSLVCLDQENGNTLWEDNSPGTKIARNQHCNPGIFRNADKSYVTIGQGDGFVRAFECETGKLAWQFDLNTKDDRRRFRQPSVEAPVLTESPVFDGQNLYFVIGADREGGAGGGIFCIDPSGSGDVSRDLEVDGKVLPNDNSKLIWEYSRDSDSEEQISCTTAGLCITDDLLIEAGFDGIVRCLDKKSGELLWKSDVYGAVIGTPLVVGDTLYVADEDGEVRILRASPTLEVIDEIYHEQPIESSVVYAEDTLIIVTRKNVFAIGR